jgi:HD-GYP domain-containing protein (c-di-GMP phosphodiesterase class II)
VTELTCAIAGEMGFAQERLEVIRLSSYIHDSGKLAVPLEILMYRTQLHEIQMGMIKIHPQNAYDILAGMDLPRPLALTIWQHHERLDGSGYPRQLRADDIIPEARILAVADVFEAMASSCPYRPALGIDRALEEISGNRGKLYDPIAADTCLKLVKEKGFKFTEPGLRDTFN